MKTKSFTLGAIAGITTVAMAIPALAQISSAAATTTTGTAAITASTSPIFARPALTQQKVLDMVARDEAFLKNIDAAVTLQKSVTQAHKTALTAAAAIADETQRQAAVKKANEDVRTTIQSAIAANPDLASALMPFGGGDHGDKRGPGGEHGPGAADLAKKLGMTEAELKAAIDSGKTIEQIATAKGITLPARPTFGGKGKMMHKAHMNGEQE